MLGSPSGKRPAFVRPLIWLTALQTGTAALHALAHFGVPVDVNPPLDNALILLVFFLGPLLGALLLRPRPALALPLLAGSFLVGILYGTLSHFVAGGSDNIGSIALSGWGPLFVATALLLPALEALGLMLVIGLAGGRARRHPSLSQPA